MIVLPKGDIVEALNANPGYDLLITGYSLGAGIGHLVKQSSIQKIKLE